MPEDDFNVEVWITKHALTEGIRHTKARIVVHKSNAFGGYTYTECQVKPNRGSSIVIDRYYDNDWHTSEYAAIERAEEMKQAKLATMMKDIYELEGKRFASLDYPYYNKTKQIENLDT